MKTASKRQYIAARVEVQVPWGGIHEWQKENMKVDATDSQNKCSSMWALSLFGEKNRAFKHCKATNFSNGLSSIPHWQSWIVGSD